MLPFTFFYSLLLLFLLCTFLCMYFKHSLHIKRNDIISMSLFNILPGKLVLYCSLETGLRHFHFLLIHICILTYLTDLLLLIHFLLYKLFRKRLQNYHSRNTGVRTEKIEVTLDYVKAHSSKNIKVIHMFEFFISQFVLKVLQAMALTNK